MENDGFVDEEGKPLAKVSIGVEETIPTAKYANVKISHFVSRYVKDDEVKEGLERSYKEADEVLQKERDNIIAELESGND